MPLQWFAGFEASDLAEMVSFTAAAVGAAYKRSGACGCRLTVPSGITLVYVSVANGYDANGNPTTVSRTAYTIGFRLRVIALPQTPGQWEHVLFIGSGTTHRASLRLGEDGTLRLHIGAVGSPHLASFGRIDLNRWYFCELAVLFDRYTWRMDGQVVAQGLASPEWKRHLKHDKMRGIVLQSILFWDGRSPGFRRAQGEEACMSKRSEVARFARCPRSRSLPGCAWFSPPSRRGWGRGRVRSALGRPRRSA